MLSDVNDSQMQITRREMQALLRDRRLWIALGALGLVLGLFGPFAIASALRTLPRIAYWLPVTVITFALGITLSALAGAEITLSDGRVLPVSRGYIADLKEAGLLPR